MSEVRNGYFFKNHHIHKQLFTAEECDNLIKHFKSNSYDNATVIDSEKTIKNDIASKRSTDIREGRLVWLRHDDETINWVFQKLFYASIWANFGWSLLPLRSLQITEYDANTDGGFYKRHRDIIMGTTPQRIISSVTQLSNPEDYTGCNLIFDKSANMPPPEEYRNQGDTIFFTSIEPHEVTPILSGKRYSLVGWFEGPNLWDENNLSGDF